MMTFGWTLHSCEAYAPILKPSEVTKESDGKA